MDHIYVNGMLFYGYHGVFQEEQRLGQRFIVDLDVALDLQQAGRNDDLTKSVNYAELYQISKNVVEGNTYQLIETVAEKIADEILTTYSNIKSCKVKVTKPDPPIPGYYQSVAVEIERNR